MNIHLVELIRRSGVRGGKRSELVHFVVVVVWVVDYSVYWGEEGLRGGFGCSYESDSGRLLMIVKTVDRCDAMQDAMATTTQQIEILEYSSDFSVYKNVSQRMTNAWGVQRERGHAGGPTVDSSHSLKTVTRVFSSRGRGRLWGGRGRHHQISV